MVLLPSTPAVADAAIKKGTAFQLLTMQRVLFEHPAPGGRLQRLQPVGGLVDAFLADPRDEASTQGWFDIWSSSRAPTMGP